MLMPGKVRTQGWWGGHSLGCSMVCAWECFKFKILHPCPSTPCKTLCLDLGRWSCGPYAYRLPGLCLGVYDHLVLYPRMGHLLCVALSLCSESLHWEHLCLWAHISGLYIRDICWEHVFL